jgi:hypothetical protein
VFFSPAGQIGPTTCGTCTMPEINNGMPIGNGQLDAPCDGANTAPCLPGLYCDAATGKCAPLAGSGMPCGVGSKPPGNPGGCTPPLSCVGLPGGATCSLGSTGAFCLDDQECAPGLACMPGPVRAGGTSGTCGGVTWGAPGAACRPSGALCLVGACSDLVSLGPPPISPDGGLYPGICPQVRPDGQTGGANNTYSACDTFAQPFLPDYKGTSPSPAGPCALIDSFVCK